MPLIERYNDWNITDRTFKDPHTLEFDHRVEADAACSGTGLARVEDNVKATCVITLLKPEFGWTRVGNEWSYDPTLKETDLDSVWRNNLPDCVQHDKDILKTCFYDSTTNPTTAYVGPEAEALPDKLDALEWPSSTTEFVSRFEPAGQHVIGPEFCSAYHLGNGYVGTAGHCLEKALVDNEVGELRVVFNWLGDVVNKKIFTASEVFTIEKIVLCDTHGPAPSSTDPAATVPWSMRWDSAILKLIGTVNEFSRLNSVIYAARPPVFGRAVYNIGSPLGTQLKVSADAHVLRHSLVGDEEYPFSHLIAGYGTFTTDLDQFEGNSGGPVFDTNTGDIIGHTSSTQDAVAESDAASIEGWADEFAHTSKNYALAIGINALLEKQEPTSRFYRVHPKFLRTLSGKPRDSPLIKCATNVCPGDLGSNKVMQAPGRYQAAFSRHQFDSKDVFVRNVTARVDRCALFMTPLSLLLSDYDACTLTIKFVGKAEVFRKPDASSTLIISSGVADWHMQDLDLHEETSLSIPFGIAVWSVKLKLALQRHRIPAAFLDTSRGLIDWTKVRLEQPLRNPPIMVGINLSIHRPSFLFPVDRTWPPGRPDVTDHPRDAELRWPEETFEFATTAGDTLGASQTDETPEKFEEGSFSQGLWTWEAPINRVWTNPRQPSQGLRDPLIDDIDAMLV